MTSENQRKIKQLIIKINELMQESPRANEDLFKEIQIYLNNYSLPEVRFEYTKLSKFIRLESFTAEQIAQLIRYGAWKFVHGRMEGRKDINITLK